MNQNLKMIWFTFVAILGIVLTILKINDLIGLRWLLIIIGGAIILSILPFLLSLKSKKKLQFPEDYQFMGEFLEAAKYIEKGGTINPYKDKCHMIMKLQKTFIIDGVDCYTEKIFHGINIQNSLTSGINVWASGGSSASYATLGVRTFDLTNGTSMDTIPKLLLEEERNKSILVPFYAPKSKNEAFIVKYVESQWKGAMRTDFDGIIHHEHIFFENGVNEYNVTLTFKKGEIEYIEPFFVDLKTSKVEKDSSIVSKMDENYCWTLKRPSIQKLYFILYKYKVAVHQL